jgi:hypothetical protein
MNKPEKKRKLDLIRDSERIRMHVIEAMKRKGYMHKHILELAEKDGKSIDAGAFSRWLKNDTSQRSTISQEEVIWLCKKLQISVTLTIKFKNEKNLDGTGS